MRLGGNDAVEVVSGNPYRLARAIRGIGFKLADTIAMKPGVEKAATTRVRAGIGYVLDEATKKGHADCPPTSSARWRPSGSKSTNLVRTALDLERVVCGKGESCVAVEDVLHRDAAPTRRSRPNAGSKPRIRRAGFRPRSGVNWSTCSRNGRRRRDAVRLAPAVRAGQQCR